MIGPSCATRRAYSFLVSLSKQMMCAAHVYEIQPRKDKRGVDLISEALPFGALWYGEPDAISNAISYAKFYSRLHDAMIRVFDATGALVDAAQQAGDFREW